MIKIKKLIGEIPFAYHRQTIYTMCLVINALVDAVNHLTEEVERLKKG